ncbi:MAG: hypothetical protein N2484_16590 [Clostridia bacterium]|nr:hypothetical protein [Clostridia bacterium]
MTGATHMIAAASIYSLTSSNKPIALAAALASHFILDSIPHHEPSTRKNYVLGFITLIGLSAIALIRKDPFFLFAVFLGAFPDLNWILKLNRQVDRFHRFVHFKHKKPVSKYISILEMILVSLFSLAIVFL